MNKLLFIVVLASVAYQALAKEVKCESVLNRNFSSGGVENTLSCLMNKTTVIDSIGFTISTPRNETIGALEMNNNSKIRFLPEEVGEQFPNLLAYYAFSCSLTEVSKINFQSLFNLKVLVLNSNKIENIAVNTFEDLKSLVVLNLGKQFSPFS